MGAEIGGNPVRAIDSGGPHEFTFTPAVLLWVDCSSRAELERVATGLAVDGSMLMPLGDYAFSELFCWVADRYGVTRQLDLA